MHFAVLRKWYKVAFSQSKTCVVHHGLWLSWLTWFFNGVCDGLLRPHQLETIFVRCNCIRVGYNLSGLVVGCQHLGNTFPWCPRVLHAHGNAISRNLVRFTFVKKLQSSLVRRLIKRCPCLYSFHSGNCYWLEAPQNCALLEEHTLLSSGGFSCEFVRLQLIVSAVVV
jgi:hypothetical protein